MPPNTDVPNLEHAQTAPAELVAVTAIGPTLRPAEGEKTIIEEREFATRYDARAILGEGGMGEVRLCRDARIGREVAMKVIRGAHGGRSDMQARFLREARVQGQLEHPSIVPVYDVGIRGNGETFFTMKRVRGLTLAHIFELLAKGDARAVSNYSRRKLLAALGSVCLAIEFAHARGVLHRDLKPGNVMLGDFGEVYVLDWGIAKVAGDATEEGATVPARDSQTPAIDPGADFNTASGSFVGSLGYVSPEQLRGDQLDSRSDVYSLGAILFEALTLLPLHAGTWAEVVASTMKHADARCAFRAPNRDVPPELEQICIKATRSDPADRFASARALNDAVQSYLDGDRDIERRRALAAAHTEAAMLVIDAAHADRGSGTANRAVALAELGRSLALDPSNEIALGAIVGLLVEPPREIPEELRTTLKASSESFMRTIAKGGIVGFSGGLIALAALPIWMGVKSWSLLLIATLCVAMALGIAFVQVRRPSPLTSYVALVFASAAFVLQSRFLGPLVLLPSVTMAMGMGYAMYPAKKLQGIALATMTMVIVAPLLLEWTGALPPSYAFRDGQMIVSSQMFTLAAGPTITLLLLSSTLLLLIAGWSIRRIRNALTEAEERLAVQAWQLRHLVPEQARQRMDLIR